MINEVTLHTAWKKYNSYTTLTGKCLAKKDLAWTCLDLVDPLCTSYDQLRINYWRAQACLFTWTTAFCPAGASNLLPLLESNKHLLPRAVVVVQLVERLLPTPEIHGLNPVIGKFYLLPTVLRIVLKGRK